MAEAGADVLRWLAETYIQETDRTTFEAHLITIGERAEEWLTSARSLDAESKPRLAGKVVPMIHATMTA
jgi:hypothetical protein